MVVDNKWDFANAMKAFSEKNNTTNCYTINSHGTGGNIKETANFDIGNEKVDVNTDFSVLKEGLENHTVFIGACNVGNISGGGDELIEKMAEATSSTIIASDHPLKSGYKYDGSDYLNYSITEIPFKPIIKNDYILSHKGNLSIPIKDVKINKDSGITWGNNFQWGYFNVTLLKY